MVPTTSQPPRHSKSKGHVQHGNPLKSITLTVNLAGSQSEDLAPLAAEKGVTLEERGGGRISLSFTASTPDEALERLRLLANLLAKKG